MKNVTLKIGDTIFWVHEGIRAGESFVWYYEEILYFNHEGKNDYEKIIIKLDNDKKIIKLDKHFHWKVWTKSIMKNKGNDSSEESYFSLDNVQIIAVNPSKHGLERLLLLYSF